MKLIMAAGIYPNAPTPKQSKNAEATPQRCVSFSKNREKNKAEYPKAITAANAAKIDAMRSAKVPRAVEGVGFVISTIGTIGSMSST